MVIKAFSILFALFFSANALAKPVELVCVSENKRSSLIITFDSNKGTVRVNNLDPIPATIRSSLIEFTLAGYFHSINRSTGKMLVLDLSDNGFLPIYSCSISKNKF